MRLGTSNQHLVLTTVWCKPRLELEQNDSTAPWSTALCALPLQITQTFQQINVL